MFAFITDPRGGAGMSDIQAMAKALRGSYAPAETWCDEHGHAAVAAVATGILPEDAWDRQPIIADDLIFAAQARIDNRDEILDRLATHRSEWSGIADSEVLHRAYRRWGEDCVQKLAGDYAFAAFHRDSGRTVAGVDHLGSVRVYYAECAGTLILSTQLNALLAHSRAPREHDLAALGLLIAPKMIPGTTPFKGVRSLVGGHLLKHHCGNTELRKWWQPAAEIGVVYRDVRDYVAHAKTVFNRAVTDRLRATGGVSTTLSGGLDSTLVAVTAAAQLKAQGRTITAYTAVPEPALACRVGPNREADDWPYAAAVAAMHDNMIHVGVTNGGRCTLDIVDTIHARSRTPMRNGANHVWLGEMATRSAQTGGRVLLTGDRGNATISYSGEGAIGDLFWRRQWATALHLAFQSAQWRPLGALRVMGRELLGEKAEALAMRLRRHPDDPLRPGEIFLRREFCEEQADALAARSPGVKERSGMIRFMKNPLKIWGADPLPQWNTEFRDPTGDRRLIECLLSFPREAFLIEGNPRGLARSMGKGQVTESVRLRTTRGEQTPELGSIISIHAPAYRAALDRAANSPLYRAIVDVDAAHASIERIVGGGASRSEPSALDRVTDVGLFIGGAIS